jgi:hypothetical protein
MGVPVPEDMDGRVLSVNILGISEMMKRSDDTPTTQEQERS